MSLDMRRRLKILSGLAVALSLGYGVKSCHDYACVHDPQAQISIPGTSWTVYARTYGCSALGTVSDVVAINRITGEKAPIISFGQQEAIKFRATTSLRLMVELGGSVVIKERHDSFDGIAVVYEYHPDDPEARAFYQLSQEKPDDPRVEKGLRDGLLKEYHKAELQWEHAELGW